jgi:phosphodiesterase/alkaline phosphatase D-like protein
LDPLKAPIDVAFTHDGADFRLVNTRTEREPRNAATIENARIVTPDQMQQLQTWLTDTAESGKPRFIDTPSVFLPRHRVAIPAVKGADKLPLSWVSTLRSDAWDGYPRSQHELLAFLVEKKHGNVVFLSGDEHVPFVTWAKITDLSDDSSVVIRSIHSSPLYAPFPFSNADPEDLAGKDEFRFKFRGKIFLCEVQTEFFDCGAGFAKIHVAQSSSGVWEYQVDFLGEHAVHTYRSSGSAPWS